MTNLRKGGLFAALVNRPSRRMQPQVWTNAMARKEFGENHNRTDVRYIRRHPKHDRFPARRLGLAALLVAVAMILLVVLPPWPIKRLAFNLAVWRRAVSSIRDSSANNASLGAGMDRRATGEGRNPRARCLQQLESSASDTSYVTFRLRPIGLGAWTQPRARTRGSGSHAIRLANVETASWRARRLAAVMR